MNPAVITGTLTTTGGSVDAIFASAREEIARVAGERTFGINRVELRPLLVVAAGEVRVWTADVDFEVFEQQERTVH